jgi:hypothetical protein
VNILKSVAFSRSKNVPVCAEHKGAATAISKINSAVAVGSLDMLFVIVVPQ